MAYRKHHRMERAARAKQFMPFDALKGFREALAQKEQEISDFYQYTKKDTCDILVEEREEPKHDICPQRNYIKKR